MKRTTFVSGVLIISLLLSACSLAGKNDPAQAAQNSGNTGGTAARQLPQATKLALGTLRLDKTSTPLVPAEAAQLLFLWKGMRNLSTEQTVANEEIQGLVKQIQDTLTPEQISAINGMNLSFQDIAVIAKETGLDLGSFGGQQFGSLSPSAQATLQANRQSGGGGGGFGIPGVGSGGGGNRGILGGPPASSTNTSGVSQTRGTGGAFSKLGVSATMIDAMIQYLQTKAK
jgi:hypothetical protein